jgi:hypothetical protein
MKEIKQLGVMDTGLIEKKSGRPERRSFSLFECPICKKQYPIRSAVGKKRKTCSDCKGVNYRKHGMSGSKVYQVYQSMKNRCNNPNNEEYSRYGGRGIKYSLNWETFEGFWKDMEEGYAEGLSIDRINNDVGYSKDNCQWIPLATNIAKDNKLRKVNQYRVAFEPMKHLVFIKEWESITSAATELGLRSSHIVAVAKGREKTHGGYAWKYTEEI